ncbi:MAG: ATP-binding protein [Cyanobacteria bacterium P01_H01_bin.121]
MTRPSIAAQSLFEVTRKQFPSVQPRSIQINTLKALVGSLVDLCIEHQMPANLWLKLPRGQSWDRVQTKFCRQNHEARGLYRWLRPQHCSSIPDDSHCLQLQSVRHGQMMLVNAMGCVYFPNHQTAPVISIPLAANILQHEYFLLCLSETLNVLVIAKRSGQRGQAAAMARESANFDDEPADRYHTLENGLEPERYLHKHLSKQPPKGQSDSNALQLIVTDRLPLIQTTLATLRSWVELEACGSTLRVEPGIAPPGTVGETFVIQRQLLSKNWSLLFKVANTAAANVQAPSLMVNWLLHQVRHRDLLWQRHIAYRQQLRDQEKLQAQYQALQQQLRFREDVLHRVVQELRTPLTNIKTALSLLHAPMLKTGQRQRYTELLNRECDRQNALIQGVLTAAQVTLHVPGFSKPTRLDDVLPAFISPYQQLAQEQQIQLTYTLAAQLPDVICPTSWLQQILTQLIDNALKFTTNGGRIWVYAQPNAEHVELTVEDTGIGITASEVPKLCYWFYRGQAGSNHHQTGAGIGLAIVKQLLDACGGKVTIKSEIGQGSTFQIYLPIANQHQTTVVLPEPAFKPTSEPELAPCGTTHLEI